MALEHAGGRLPVSRVEREADALAARLAAACPGADPPCVVHRFGLLPAAVIALHAVARAGGRVALAHPAWDDDQLATFLGAVDPDLWVAPRGAEPPGPGWAAVPDPASGTGSEASADPASPAGIDVYVRARAEASTSHGPSGPTGGRLEPPPGTDVLLSTSGTGGAPRVVCHSWGTLATGAVAAARRNRFGPGDAWLASLAWAHVGGLAVAVRAAVGGGRVVIGPERFEPAGVAEAIERFGVTHASLVPAMLHALLERGVPAPASLRCVLLGGAATPPELARRALAAGWPVALTYGLTEMGSQVATGEPGTTPGVAGVVGPPLDGVELSIGAAGEIEVGGPARMLGYAGEPLAPGKRVATGDVGEIDDAGRLCVTGRRADRIVSGGTNVNPQEVEAVLVAHPAVREACVVGTPDDVWGEIVTAVIVPTLHEPEGLREWAAERLTGARRPRRWVMVEALPRTATGKVDRARVRARAAGDDGE